MEASYLNHALARLAPSRPGELSEFSRVSDVFRIVRQYSSDYEYVAEAYFRYIGISILQPPQIIVNAINVTIQRPSKTKKPFSSALALLCLSLEFLYIACKLPYNAWFHPALLSEESLNKSYY